MTYKDKYENLVAQIKSQQEIVSKPQTEYCLGMNFMINNIASFVEFLESFETEEDL